MQTVHVAKKNWFYFFQCSSQIQSASKTAYKKTLQIQMDRYSSEGIQETNTTVPRKDTESTLRSHKENILECYMGWFPSLICKNYIFKYFVKTVEDTSLKFCMILKLVSLHAEKPIPQVKCANFSNAHAETFVLLNGEMAIASTCFRKLKF